MIVNSNQRLPYQSQVVSNAKINERVRQLMDVGAICDPLKPENLLHAINEFGAQDLRNGGEKMNRIGRMIRNKLYGAAGADFYKISTIYWKNLATKKAIRQFYLEEIDKFEKEDI
jgi:hypothetical protein